MVGSVVIWRLQLQQSSRPAADHQQSETRTLAVPRSISTVPRPHGPIRHIDCWPLRGCASHPSPPSLALAFAWQAITSHHGKAAIGIRPQPIASSPR
jgi:hypothetical protein